MNKIKLNHLIASEKLTLGAYSLLVAGVFSMVLVAQQLATLDTNILKIKALEVDTPQSKQRQKMPLTDEQVKLNRAIEESLRQINMPWVGLFQSLERASQANVILRAIEPNASTGKLVISGATTNINNMMAYLHNISQLPELENAVITSHELDSSQGELPVNFVLEAIWRK